MNPFPLKPSEIVARARSDLRMGAPVLLRDGESRRICLAAEPLTAQRFAAMQSLSDTATQLAITVRRAETLKARAYDGDVARVIVPPDADAGWVRSVADPALDLASPMKGPFRTARDGSADIARAAIQLAKDARLLPAVLLAALPADCDVSGITSLDVSTLDHRRSGNSPMHPLVSARVPLMASRAGRVHVFRPEDGGEEHYAIEIGQPDRSTPVLARLHSACFTGDVLGSLKCDCGPQLRGALQQMGEAGAGVLLYLNQEGRGIGLANKMRAYALQDQGFDTVAANHRLGFEDDERDFRIGSDILKRLGFSSVRLMTNNPAKIDMMNAQGVHVVERVPLALGRTPENDAYLQVKAEKSGHLF